MLSDTSVIIVAGGKGSRMGQPKQLLKIAGKEILRRSITQFFSLPFVKEIIVVCPKETFDAISKYFKGLIRADAGATRLESVKNGFAKVNKKTKLVAIHDGARPLVNPTDIENCLKSAKKNKASVLGVMVKDTIKVLENGKIKKTLKRETLFSAQTPQCYQYKVIKDALEKFGNNTLATDESQLVEKLGINVAIVLGSYENIKITTPEDLIIAEALCKKK